VAIERWSVRRLLEWTETFLKGKGIESPRLEAQILLSHVLKCPKIQLYVRHDEEPAETQKAEFRELIRKRAEGVPVAYLVGQREFFSLSFDVSPAVLIPRPDTELVVVESLKILKGLTAPEVLDLGTGSGCIAVTIAKHHPTAKITAVDLSPAAIEIAQANATKHGVADRVRFRQGDLFAPVTGERFRLIVSNPPYISTEEYLRLDPTVRDHEPRSALEAPEEGLAFYRRIAAEAAGYLQPEGWVLLEVGHTQSVAVETLIRTGPRLEFRKTFHDLSKTPRVAAAQLARE
jgi:release factor glutamine methyltransferase